MENKSEIKTEWTYDANSCSLKIIREDFKQYLNANNVDDVSTGYIIIAVNEICMNIMQHADGGHYSGKIHLSASIIENVLSIWVEDEAASIDVNMLKVRDIDKLEPGGLGLFLVNDIMDTVSYINREHKSGNCLMMTKILGNTDGI